MNNIGGFECECAPGTSGHLCQFTDQCQADNTCSEGNTYCIVWPYYCRSIASLNYVEENLVKNFQRKLFEFFSDNVCVSTLSADGFICREAPSASTSIVISFTGNNDVGFLNDLIQGFIEIQLVSRKQ